MKDDYKGLRQVLKKVQVLPERRHPEPYRIQISHGVEDILALIRDRANSRLEDYPFKNPRATTYWWDLAEAEARLFMLGMAGERAQLVDNATNDIIAEVN